MRRSGASRPSTPTGVPSVSGPVSATDVDRAADALLRDGQRPTIEKVRLKIGRGSPNTINPLLDAWWSRLAGRLDAGPAALHRLPEPVLHAAEGLWLRCLEEARRRAKTEDQSSRKALTRERQDLEVRSHILSIREAELAKRVEAAEERAGRLELEVEALTTLLRKEQASRLAAERQSAGTGSRPGRKSTRPAARSARAGKATRPAKRRAKPARPARKTSPSTRTRPRTGPSTERTRR